MCFACALHIWDRTFSVGGLSVQPASLLDQDAPHCDFLAVLVIQLCPSACLPKHISCCAVLPSPADQPVRVEVQPKPEAIAVSSPADSGSSHATAGKLL